jgi:hypothetical protein
MIQRTIAVEYSCKACGVQRRKVQVLARAASQDIKEWLDCTAAKVGEDHSHYSPSCPERKCDLYIPLNKDREDRGIGEALEV